MLILPVMLPMAASAFWSCMAAVLLANISGTLVPKATIVIPATAGSMYKTHASK